MNPTNIRDLDPTTKPNQTLTPYHVVHIVAANAPKIFNRFALCLPAKTFVGHIGDLSPTICDLFLCCFQIDEIMTLMRKAIALNKTNHAVSMVGALLALFSSFHLY